MRFIYTKQFVVFSIAVLLTAVLVFLESQGWLEPFKRTVLYAPRPVIVLGQKIASPIKGFFATVYGIKDIAEENAELEGQIVSLKQDLADLEKQRKENEALRRELGFAKAAPHVLVPCTVLSQNPFGLTDSVVINCGEDHSLKEGMAAVSQGYLVGKVVFVGSKTSTVLLAVSSKFSTDAAVSSTGKTGIVKGSFGSGLILDQLSQDAGIEKGFLVVTAGIDQNIPEGILIGEVGEVISTPSELFKKATLITPINFDNFEFVFVVEP